MKGFSHLIINRELQILLVLLGELQQFRIRHHLLMDQQTQHLRRLVHQEFLS